MEGQFPASVVRKGKGPVQFQPQTSIIIHLNGQELISYDTTNHIQVINEDLVLTFSHPFTTHGPPWGVGEGHYDMAVDSHGIVYVTDPRDDCI